MPGMALEYLPEMQGFPHFKHPKYETVKQHPSPAPSSLFHEAASDKRNRETCTETMRMVWWQLRLECCLIIHMTRLGFRPQLSQVSTRLSFLISMLTLDWSVDQLSDVIGKVFFGGWEPGGVLPGTVHTFTLLTSDSLWQQPSGSPL